MLKSKVYPEGGARGKVPAVRGVYPHYLQALRNNTIDRLLVQVARYQKKTGTKIIKVMLCDGESEENHQVVFVLRSLRVRGRDDS